MRAAPWRCAFVVAFAAFASHARADLPKLSEPERVDGVAALVGGTAPGEGVLVLLRSDVVLRARLSLLAAGAHDPAHTPLPRELLAATLDELLGESLVVIEASRLGLGRPTTEDLKQQRMRLAESAGPGGLAELTATWGVSEPELFEIARRRAIVGAFLAANLEGTLDTSQSELSRAFQSEDHPFQDDAFELAQQSFSAWYAQKRLRDAVARWVVSLRERTPHKVVWRP